MTKPPSRARIDAIQSSARPFTKNDAWVAEITFFARSANVTAGSFRAGAARAFDFAGTHVRDGSGTTAPPISPCSIPGGASSIAAAPGATATGGDSGRVIAPATPDPDTGASAAPSSASSACPPESVSPTSPARASPPTTCIKPESRAFLLSSRTGAKCAAKFSAERAESSFKLACTALTASFTIPPRPVRLYSASETSTAKVIFRSDSKRYTIVPSGFSTRFTSASRSVCRLTATSGVTRPKVFPKVTTAIL